MITLKHWNAEESRHSPRDRAALISAFADSHRYQCEGKKGTAMRWKVEPSQELPDAERLAEQLIVLVELGCEYPRAEELLQLIYPPITEALWQAADVLYQTS